MAAFLFEETLFLMPPGDPAPSPVRMPVPGAECIADDGKGRVVVCTGPTWEKSSGPTSRYRVVREGAVSLYRVDVGVEGVEVVLEATLELGEGRRPMCALFHGDVLFVAGRVQVAYSGEWGTGVGDKRPFLAVWDLAAPGGPARFDAATPPLALKTFDKRAIDALAVDGGRLLAFDNVLRPVYVFIYDLADPRRPAFREARDVTGGLWARIVRVAMSSRFVVALQTQGSRRGPTYTVILLDRGSLERVAAMSHRPGTTRLPTFRAIAVVDDVLFIASATRGLGWLDLRALDGVVRGDRADVPLADLRERLAEDEARLANAVAWSLALGEDVLDVCAAEDGCVALARGEDGELRAQVFEVARPLGG